MKISDKFYSNYGSPETISKLIKYMNKLTHENVLKAMRKSKIRKRAINKIVLDMELDVMKDKEDVRKLLYDLERKGYVYREEGQDGVWKWCLKNWEYW